MITTIRLNPADKEKFKHVLNLSNQLRLTDINILTEADDSFEIEYLKEQHLFNLGRAFEPYKMPTKGFLEVNYDNSYINKI